MRVILIKNHPAENPADDIGTNQGFSCCCKKIQTIKLSLKVRKIAVRGIASENDWEIKHSLE